MTRFDTIRTALARPRPWRDVRVAAAAATILTIGVGALGLVAWQGSHAPRPQETAAIAAAAPSPPVKPPLKPEDWRGDIDYRGLDARLQTMMTDRAMQGLAVAVVENGRLSFVRGYGATTPEGNERIGADTVFRWASLSKTVASTLSVVLAEHGVLSLSDPLGKFNTSLRLPGDAQDTLTVEQLLSQRTGLPKNAYDGWLEGGRDPKLIRQSLGTVPLMCPPGLCHSYQNIAYDTIREVVETATHQPYALEAREQLFQPLGMRHTTIGLEGLKTARSWAKPTRNGHTTPLVEAYYRVPAAAGVNSSILDLAVWMQAQMGLASAVLPDAAVADIQRPRVNTGRPYGGSPFGRALEKPAYGLAMRSFTFRGHRLVGHSGAVDGYRSTMMFDPVTKTGIVMLWNSEGSLPFRFQGEFFDRAYGLPFKDWLQMKDAGAVDAS
jgi:beta-lactamase class C